MRKIIALMICTLFLASQGTSEVVISNSNISVEPEVGDYIILEIIDNIPLMSCGSSDV